MIKYLVSISYDGSSFSGWAKQPKKKTIQDSIENSLNSIFSLKKRFSVVGASRTDKGVHAIDQKFTFIIPVDIESSKMNSLLKKSLESSFFVNWTKKVENNFNILKNVKMKEYRYILKFKNYNIFDRKYCFYFENINFQKLKNTLSLFEGYQNFFNFSCIRERDKFLKNTFRKIESIKILKRDKDSVYIVFLASGFLRYQIRAILGESIENHLKEDGDKRLKEMLICQNGSKKYVKIAPPSGLYLWRIDIGSRFEYGN